MNNKLLLVGLCLALGSAIINTMGTYIPKSLLLYFGLLLLAMSGFFLTAILPIPTGLYAFIITVALGGFGVSATIYYTKRSHKQLVCPAGSDCNAVVTSRYAKFLRIPLEYLGMTYFAAIAILYAAKLFLPNLIGSPMLLLLLLLSTGGFLFSLYLLFVQAFLLRQWCIWCILAAALSMTVFFISLGNLEIAVTFLKNIANLLGMIQFFGFALGIGGCTSAIFLFAKFLQNLNIDSKEAAALRRISELIWIGLTLTIMSQFALYAAQAENLAHSPTFLAQILSLFGVAISGAVLWIIFAPFITHLPFSKSQEKTHHDSFISIRKAIFITGSITISSWYFAFTTNYLPEFPFLMLISAYGLVLFAAVIASLAAEHILVTRKAPK